MAKIDNAFTQQSTLSGAAGGLAEQLIDSAVGALSPLNNFGRYLTGSRAIIKINNKLFGFAFRVSYNIQTTQDEVWTIDDWTPWEFAPKRVMVSGSMSMFHIPGKGPTKELVMQNILSFLHHKYITIEIRDQMTDQIIFATNKAVITGKRQTIASGEMSTVELSWKSLGWSDELTPFFPQGYDGQAGGGSTLDTIGSAIGNLFG